MNTDYVVALVEAVYSFIIVSRCFLTFSHARPFMVPFHISFRNVNHTTTSALCFFVSLVASTGKKVYDTFSCISAVVIAASPRFLKFLYLFSAYCAMNMWSMWFSLFSSSMSVFRWN